MKTLQKITLVGLVLLMMLTACTQSTTAPESDNNTPASDITDPSRLLPTTTPTSVLSPTLPPAEMVDEGAYALFVGDYETARKTYENILAQTNDPDITARSQLGLGQALFRMESFGLARDQFAAAAQAEDPTTAARASYMLGQTYTRLERYVEALQAYEAYLELRPGLLDSHIHTMRGDLFAALGDQDQVIAALEESFRTDPAGGTESQAVRIAVAYENTGQVDMALALYQDIASTTSNDYTKAEMNLRIGRIFLSREDPAQAYTYLLDSVENAPFAYDAYTALVILVEAGVPVNEYQRGLVNHYVGNHALAIEAFDRYLESGEETNADAALYRQALSTRALTADDPDAQYEAAIDLWEQLILTYPASSYYVDAWQGIEYTLWAFLGEPQAAAEHALKYVAQRPESPEAPDFLFLAGRSYERAGMLSEASAAWQRIASEYPDAAEAFRATYFAGIAHVRMGDWAGALPLFSRALVLTSEPEQLAAAHLWIGKCQEAQGEISAALDSWKLAQTDDPFGHYSIRAEDLLIGREVFTDPTSFTLDPDLTPYRQEAEDWLRLTFNLAADTNLESPGLLANDPRYQRGLEYWSLGSYEAGKAELEALRAELASDPAQTFRLIPALVEIGLYRSALVASTELLRQAGLSGADALSAPEYFSRVRFGAYYLDWLLPEAADKGISPLLLLSVIRQESTYEGFISSSADARGLMQIIRSTGDQLAAELNWPENYTIADLNRPYVSLVFGTAYLRKQRNYFNGDLFAMLAAYNGGPGNTIAWKDLTPFDDPDLFLEIVRIEETRNYIRLINEIHYIYRWLYGEPDDL